MTLNWERETFDDFILLFNNQSLSMSKDSSNNILSLKFSSNEISRTIDLNSAMRINFSDKGNFSLRNRDIKTSIGIDISFEAKTPWQMYNGFPETVSEYSGEFCTMFFLSKTPVGFLIMVILKESFAGFFKGSKGRTIMSSENSLLPESIKTLNRGISTRFSLWNKDQMYSHEQMEADKLRYAERIASSSCSSHLIIHLGYLWKPNKSPCFNQMSAKRYSLFISKLTCESCMSCHIQSMEGIESGNPFWTSDVSRSNKVCLMKVSNLLCSKARIWLTVVISLDLNSTCLSVTRENSGNSGNRWDIANLSLRKLPMDNLSSNAREGRTSGLVRFQFLPDGEDLFNHMLRGFSPDSFWSAVLISETFKTILFKSIEPFREPSFAPLNQMECFIETISFFMKMYRFAAFFILVSILHRLSLLPNVFGKSLGDIKISIRCYDIFKVYYVMI